MTDDRSARLFSAARVERPNGEVRDRTLSAMLELAHAPESEVRPEPSLRRPLAVAIAAVAIAAAFAVLVRRHDAPVNDGTLVAETIAPTPPSASLVASASPPVSV